MQSLPGAPRAFAAHKHDWHFANPSVGWANFPPEKAVGVIAGGPDQAIAGVEFQRRTDLARGAFRHGAPYRIH